MLITTVFTYSCAARSGSQWFSEPRQARGLPGAKSRAWSASFDRSRRAFVRNKNPRAVVGTPGGSGRRGRGRWGGWECPAAPQGGRKKPLYSRRAAVRDAQKRCANQRGSLTRPRVRLALHAPDACFTPWRRAEWQVGPLRGSGPSRIPFACCLPFIRASPFRRSSVLEASVPSPPFIARACGTREMNPIRSRESDLDQLHPMLAPQFRHL